jgi:hypothetical protein
MPDRPPSIRYPPPLSWARNVPGCILRHAIEGLLGHGHGLRRFLFPFPTLRATYVGVCCCPAQCATAQFYNSGGGMARVQYRAVPLRAVLYVGGCTGQPCWLAGLLPHQRGLPTACFPVHPHTSSHLKPSAAGRMKGVGPAARTSTAQYADSCILYLQHRLLLRPF